MIKKSKLFDIDSISQKTNVFGLNQGLVAKCVHEMFEHFDQNVLLLVNYNSDINELYNELVVYTDDILTFPMDNFWLKKVDAISPEFMQERYDTLVNLHKDRKKIVITSLEGYTHQLLNKDSYYDKSFIIKIGELITREKLESFLNDNLYDRVLNISRTGEYAIRGSVVDIFLEEYDDPIRIEFWGDEVESVRQFSVDTQRTTKILDEIKLFPNPDCFENDNTATIIDYVDGINLVVNADDINTRYINELNKEICFDKFNNKFFTFQEINDLNNSIHFQSEPITGFNSNIEEFITEVSNLTDDEYSVYISLDSKNQVDTIKEILPVSDKIFIDVFHVNSGFKFISNKVCLINSAEIFNKTVVKKKYRNKFKFSNQLNSIDSIVKGDYVVHDTHGIGKYNGIKTIESEINGEKITKDFFEIEYKKSDKLFVPIEQISYLQKYSSESSFVPKLNSLGSGEFEKTKAKIKERMKEIAEKLLVIYSKREQAVGFSCKKDSIDQEVFEAEFEFDETEDQKTSIMEIKRDMESKYPMDRLLCGDVGFGKTEVAFRAAFKAMDNNKQVIYICPTTILSIQQYSSAISRFSNVPVNIELLNRFTTQKKRSEILEGLKKGGIDFVIGTHSLLNDKIAYKDLGLLIIDEEQRFGVEQKEKIKELKSEVDVLSMSATPIPRTLQMSLTGIRKMSVINTAPTNRFPIQTYVVAYNESIIIEAIKNEISRKGQVFILCNKISDHPKIAKIIKQHDESIKVINANGKMSRDMLEEIFFNFTNHEYQVLIATTIIETGINVPNANTLIILEANMFGLAQLYQIRGRIGRSDRIGYAYLMYNPGKVLTESSKQRLEAIKNFTSLGSGFKIASRDLSIRGAGDILGSDQAGFIDNIGLSLYMKLLKEVANGSEEIQEKKYDVTNYSKYIPEHYVNNDEYKLELHQKISNIKNKEEYDKIHNEILDLYGKLPIEIEKYMKDKLFEVDLQEFGVFKINEGKYEVIVYINIINLDGAKLLESVTKCDRNIKISSGVKHVEIKFNLNRHKNWKKMLQEIIKSYN